MRVIKKIRTMARAETVDPQDAYEINCIERSLSSSPSPLSLHHPSLLLLQLSFPNAINANVGQHFAAHTGYFIAPAQFAAFAYTRRMINLIGVAPVRPHTQPQLDSNSGSIFNLFN